MKRGQRNERIVELRKQGWKQGDIATEVGCSLRTVGRILKGAGCTPGKIVQLVAERLQSKLIVASGGCLEYQGYRNSSGYGIIKVDGEALLAHRVAFELAHGPIPSGLFVCHSCDNPSCCNSNHLFLGTPADNMADKVSKDRQFTKRTPEKLQRLGELRDQGLSSREIGTALGVNQMTVLRWLRELEAK